MGRPTNAVNKAKLQGHGVSVKPELSMNKWVCKTLKTPFMNRIIQPLPSLLAFHQETNMVLLVGSPYHSISLLWIQRQHFPSSCWTGFKAVPLTRCVTHTKFAKLLLSRSLLICENRDDGSACIPELFWGRSMTMGKRHLSYSWP